MPFDPVTYAIPVFIALILGELLWSRRTGARHAYEWRDTGTSLAIGLGSTVAGALTGGLTAAMLAGAHDISPFRLAGHGGCGRCASCWTTWPTMSFIAAPTASAGSGRRT